MLTLTSLIKFRFVKFKLLRPDSFRTFQKLFLADTDYNPIIPFSSVISSTGTLCICWFNDLNILGFNAFFESYKRNVMSLVLKTVILIKLMQWR